MSGDIVLGWRRLLGSPEKFTMENRAFNFVCLISSVLLLYYIAFDLYLAQYTMSFVLFCLMLVLSVIFYFSRFKKKYKMGIIIYGILSYTAIILNYKYDGGAIGPTLFVFMVTFMFLIAVSDKRSYPLLIFIHLVIAFSLLYIELQNPLFVVKGIYKNKFENYLDIFCTYSSIIFIIYFVTNFLRRHYEYEKKLADLRAAQIIGQNKRIVDQNKELGKLNDEKNKLFSIISHDLRTPVNSLIGYLEVLKDYDIPVDERRELEVELMNQTKYASELLQNLLYWTKTQMKGVTISKSPFRYKDLIDVTFEYKNTIAANKNIKLINDFDNDTVVEGDIEMMRIVFRNLVNNAIKFTKEGGAIIIRTYKSSDNQEGVLSIIDNGIGMSEEKQNELFTLTSKSTYGTNAEKGVGIGLLICKDFMEYQGGRIWFESKEGSGSTFFVSLPLAN